MANAIIRLRRDNDYNYDKIKDRFIPADGEICLVDTARDGLRAVCGDGKTPFGQLKYIGEIVIQGYFADGAFYTDSAYTTLISPSPIHIYISIDTHTVYYFDGKEYHSIGAGGNVQIATDLTPGVMKLYNTIGSNTDGTMTQKAITDELDDKVEVTVNSDEELIIFTTDQYFK